MFTEEQEGLVVQWEAELCEQNADTVARAAARRASAFACVEHFFALHYEQILQLSKPTLRDVVMSTQAHKHRAWMQAQNFYQRHLPLVTPEQQELLKDWEFVLCDTSTLLPVALLPRLQRCMDRSRTFVNQNAELMKKLQGKTLQAVLRGRHLKENSMAVFTSLWLDRYRDQLTEEQEELVLQWEADLCEQSAEIVARVAASRARALARVQHFFAEHADKIVQLARQTMRDVVNVNLARSHVDWMHTKNFYTRQWHLLTVEEKELLDDWEFALCDTTRLDAMALLPRIDRCFDRSHGVLQESAEAIQQLGAASLQGILHSRLMREKPMSVFIRVFLERYYAQFTEAQRETLSMWEAEFCRISPEADKRARRTCARTFLRTQDFLAKFADEIVRLQKVNLREVVLSNQAKKHAEWSHAQNFFIRHLHFLTLDERELLEDWEFTLCYVPNMEPDTVQGFHHRCLQRVHVLLTERADAIHKVGVRNLDLALRSRHMLQFPMSTFARVFLERHGPQLAADQSEAIRVREKKLCPVSATAREEASRSRAEGLLQFEGFLSQHATEIRTLQRSTLQEVVMSNQAKRYSDWKQAQNFWVRHVSFLSAEQKVVLEDWEVVLCDMSTLQTVALLPRLQRCFWEGESICRRTQGVVKVTVQTGCSQRLTKPRIGSSSNGFICCSVVEQVFATLACGRGCRGGRLGT